MCIRDRYVVVFHSVHSSFPKTRKCKSSCWAGGNKPSDFCDEKTGLPWVMHDGYSGSTYNPVMRTLDRAKVDALWDAANPLSLGFWFTNQTKYLTKAASLFRTFFLDPETRMNPNLEYAVTEPGCKVCNDGTNDPAKCGWGGTVQLARIRYALSCICLLYTSPSPRDATLSRMPSSA